MPSNTSCIVRCCKFNKISQNTVAIFLRHHFYRNRYFWFRCFLSVLRMAHMWLLIWPKIVTELAKNVQYYTLTYTHAHVNLCEDEERERELWRYIIHIGKKISNNDSIFLWIDMWKYGMNNQYAIWRSVEAQSHILWLNFYFSTILTFIVNLPIGFLPIRFECICAFNCNEPMLKLYSDILNLACDHNCVKSKFQSTFLSIFIYYLNLR